MSSSNKISLSSRHPPACMHLPEDWVEKSNHHGNFPNQHPARSLACMDKYTMPDRLTILGKLDLPIRTNRGDAVSTRRERCQQRPQADLPDREGIGGCSSRIQVPVWTGKTLPRRSLPWSGYGCDEEHHAGPPSIPPIHCSSWHGLDPGKSLCLPLHIVPLLCTRTLTPAEHIPASHNFRVVHLRRKDRDECQRGQLDTNHSASPQRITTMTWVQFRSMAYVQEKDLH